MQKNKALSGLRGLVVFLIVFHHYSCRYGEIFTGPMSIQFPFDSSFGGIIGNIVFFVMTGFFMAKSLLVGEGGIKAIFNYSINRYWRFWPTYAIAVLLISIVLYFLPLPGRSDSLSLTTVMVDFFCIYHPGFDNIDGSHWFLSSLLIIQIGLSFVLLVKNQIKRKILIIALFVILFIMYVLGSLGIHFLVNHLPSIFYSFLVLTGILIYIFKDAHWVWIPAVVEIFLLLLFENNIIITVSVSFLLILFVLMIQRPNLFSIIGSKIIVKVGDVSFAWYLLHQNIGYVVMFYLLPKGEISLLWLLIPMCTTFLLAFLTTLLVDRLPKKLLE